MSFVSHYVHICTYTYIHSINTEWDLITIQTVQLVTLLVRMISLLNNANHHSLWNNISRNFFQQLGICVSNFRYENIIHHPAQNVCPTVCDRSKSSVQSEWFNLFSLRLTSTFNGCIRNTQINIIFFTFFRRHNTEYTSSNLKVNCIKSWKVF